MTSTSPTLSEEPQSLVLGAGEIHVWWAFLEQPLSRLQRLARTLSLDERKRASRYHIDRDRKYFTVGRGILRTILGKYLGRGADRLQFYYGNKGKPALTDNSGPLRVHFNLSHSGRIALYAFTRGEEIGVDMEKIRHLDDMEQIAQRFFSEREKADFFVLPQDQKRAAFFTCWTRKEAFLKAIGTGLSHSLDEFDVSLVPGEPARVLRIDSDTVEASRWSIHELKPVPGYVAAIAIRRYRFEIKCRHWTV